MIIQKNLKSKLASLRYVIFILLFISINGHSQELDIFGYFEPQIMGAKIKNDFFQMSSNKLRVDLELQTSENVSFGANFDYITYHGKTEWPILDYLPETVTAEVPQLNVAGFEIDPYFLIYEDRQFLDNAYVKLSFKYFDLTLGKQQLSFGTGYAWNPTDVFNKKDVMDPTYEQPGYNALKLECPIGNDFGMTAIYAPTEDWDYTDALLKFKGRLGHFDFSILGIQKHWKYTDARIIDPNLLKMNFYQVNTKRHIFGGDIVGELLGLGVWAEYSYNKVKINDDENKKYNANYSLYSQILTGPMIIKDNFYELVVGADYTFDFQTYVMCEFYRNTAAKTNYQDYNFNDWMQMLSGETRTICQDQAYFFIKHPITDLIDVGASSILSLSDESIALIPMLTYNIFENVDLTMFINYYLGDEGTVYSKNLGNGGILRARVYF